MLLLSHAQWQRLLFMGQDKVCEVVELVIATCLADRHRGLLPAI